MFRILASDLPGIMRLFVVFCPFLSQLHLVCAGVAMHLKSRILPPPPPSPPFLSVGTLFDGFAQRSGHGGQPARGHASIVLSAFAVTLLIQRHSPSHYPKEHIKNN
jgi:hypothetical protein